jgi:hypothetical protein
MNVKYIMCLIAAFFCSVLLQGCLLDIHPGGRGQAPAACYNNWDCPIGTYCEFDGYCYESPSQTSCWSDYDCALGFYCNIGGVCYEDILCWSDYDCGYGFFCASNGACYENIGLDCRVNYVCPRDTYCATDGMCHPRY